MTPLYPDLDAPTQSLLGLAALAAELAAEGVSVNKLFANTGVHAKQLEDSSGENLTPATSRDLSKRSTACDESRCWIACGCASEDQ